MSSKRIPLERTLVVGVDVGSEKHQGYLRGPEGLEVRAFPFNNDRSGFGLLASRVSEARAGYPCRLYFGWCLTVRIAVFHSAT